MPIIIEARSAKSQYAYGEPLLLDVRVRNTGHHTVYVVGGRPSTLESSGSIHVTFGVADTHGRLLYFSFTPPPMFRLAAAHEHHITTKAGMPPQVVAVDDDGHASLVDVAVGGPTVVRVAIGFLDHEFRPQTSDPRGEFVAQQHWARSNEMLLEIEHARSAGRGR